MRPKIKLWFCDFWHAETEGEIRTRNPVYAILRRRFDIVLESRAPDFVIYSGGGRFNFRRFRCPRVFYTGENTRPDFSECDFALSFDRDIPGRNHRLPLYARHDLSSLLLPRAATPADKTAFCNFIYTNANCETRNRFFHLLNAQKKVESAGRLFNNTPPPSDRNADDFRRDKIPFMRRHKFTIAFENESYPGYITEKTADAFLAETVPIYWGCPNVAEEFNPAAFVNCHNFPDLESVAREVLRLDANGDEYARMLAAPPFAGNELPPAARHRRMLDFMENVFANPPRTLAANSAYSRLIRNMPRFIHKRVIRKRRDALKYRAVVL